jgi:hypothetical protein
MQANRVRVLVAPLPRYLYNACCRDAEHLKNLHKDDHDCEAEKLKIKKLAWVNNCETPKPSIQGEQSPSIAKMWALLR